MSFVQKNLYDLSSLVVEVADTMESEIVLAGQLIRNSLVKGHRVLACGNGGSAADAQHFVAELVVKMGKVRESFPAISLSSDPSVVTATANDFGFAQVFARQVEGLGREDDVLVALTTSGKSENVINALKAAHHQNMRTVVLCGNGGDPYLDECDFVLRVPSWSTQLIQEVHMPILHCLCAVAEGSA